jgi:hypothetical protein
LEIQEQIVSLGDQLVIRAAVKSREDATSTCKIDKTMLSHALKVRTTLMYVEWVFQPFQTGETQVITTVSSSRGDWYVLTQRTNIHIEAPNVEKADLPLSWVQFAGSGLTRIQNFYPSAKVQEIHATPYRGGCVDNPLELSKLKIICVLENDRTAIMKSVGWGEFGEIQVSDECWAGDEVVFCPFRLDPVSSFLKLRNAWYKGKVSMCTMRKPEHLNIKERYRIYTMEDGSFV